MAVPDGSSAVVGPGVSPVVDCPEEVPAGLVEVLAAGTDVGMGAWVATELPPQAVNRNKPATSATPNVQKRLVLTKVPPG